MKRNALVLLLILALVISAVVGILFVKVPLPKTITVPDDYPTIQAAIDNASTGDTVFVKKGEYYLPPTLSINESLSLIGEEAQHTIINGRNPPRGSNLVTLQIGAPDVTISGFTIVNCLNAILVQNWAMQSVPSRCKIVGNIITNNTMGIEVGRGDNFLIQNNVITHNDDGILISTVDSNAAGVISGNQITENALGINLNSKDVTVNGNTVAKNQIGINLQLTGPYGIFSNNITDNTNTGIQFYAGVSKTTAFNNEIFRNGIGVELENFQLVGDAIIGSGNFVYHNNIVGNLQNAFVQHSTSYTEGLNGTDVVSWDNSERGNYWSDYGGQGTYVIDENNIDHYPLMQPVDISGTPTIIAIAVIATVVVVVFTGLIFYLEKRKH
jgi:parallel beta-helix repeat protein